MKSNFPLFTTQQYLREREMWLREIGRGENVSVVFFPKTDRFRRLHQLLEDKAFLMRFFNKKMSFLFQMMDFNVSLVEDRFDIQEHLARQLNLSNFTEKPRKFDEWMTEFRKQQRRFIIILPDAEKYLTTENKHILSLLFEVQIDYAPTIAVMSFYEVDLTHPNHLMLFPVIKEMFENIFFYPLYDSTDTLGFMRYLQKKWDMSIPKAEEERILTTCGGHFWLVKEAAREFLNGASWSMDAEGMRFRLETIYASLLSSEQSVIEKILARKRGRSPEEVHSEGFLTKMNFLDATGQLKAHLFEEFLRTHVHMRGELVLENGRVTLNHVPLVTVLSRKEYRVLKALVEKQGEVVSRDALAKAIWTTGTESQYFDWAIDQVVARLRKRLTSLGLPAALVQSVRGKGYLLNERIFI